MLFLKEHVEMRRKEQIQHLKSIEVKQGSRCRREQRPRAYSRFPLEFLFPFFSYFG